MRIERARVRAVDALRQSRRVEELSKKSGTCLFEVVPSVLLVVVLVFEERRSLSTHSMSTRG
jgi:hypothetical protein